MRNHRSDRKPHVLRLGQRLVKVVGDTVESLTAMACHSRKESHGTVIGVTGSVGKATTMSTFASALQSLGCFVHQSLKIFNNIISVARTLIIIPRDGDIIELVELGISRK